MLVAVQSVESRACSPPSGNTPTPTTPGSTSPATVFTTEDGVRFVVATVASNLQVPWSMAFGPDGRLFLTERPGRVRILNLAAGSSDLALTLDDVFADGEAGLLGLALDPDFAQTRLVYLYYSARLSGGSVVNRIVRYREVASRLAERAVLLDSIPAASIHAGGRLRFSPDGLLFATTGDAANSNLAQDLASMAGAPPDEG